MKEIELIYGIDDIENIVKKYIFSYLKKYKIFTFNGPLGVGKTTLIKAIFKSVGIDAIIVSPTFNYVNRYINSAGKYFYHFDLYRFETVNDFLDLGFDEYFYKKESWLFIEWPEIINDFLKDNAVRKVVCNIFLKYNKKDLSSRILKIVPLYQYDFLKKG